jgi:hypothetical protein
MLKLSDFKNRSTSPIEADGINLFVDVYSDLVSQYFKDLATQHINDIFEQGNLTMSPDYKIELSLNCWVDTTKEHSMEITIFTKDDDVIAEKSIPLNPTAEYRACILSAIDKYIFG